MSLSPIVRIKSSDIRAPVSSLLAVLKGNFPVSQCKLANAITDASRALEEALRYLGAVGNGPGELFQDARKRQILKPQDLPLFEVLAKAVNWVSAQRANEGDAHRQTDPSNSEAWATVYICGALIL